MKRIDQIMKEKHINADFVYSAKCKVKKEKIDEQDKRHIRLMAISSVVKTRPELFDWFISKNFTEHFYYDKEESIAYYMIEVERKVGKKRGDA